MITMKNYTVFLFTLVSLLLPPLNWSLSVQPLTSSHHRVRPSGISYDDPITMTSRGVNNKRQHPTRNTTLLETKTKGRSGNEDQENCVCISFHLCGNPVTDGAGFINPREKANPRNKLNEETEGVKKPKFCGTHHVCCNEAQVSTEMPYVHKCGIAHPTKVAQRILSVEKSESEFGEWPWQAAILRFESPTRIHFECGGTLIDDYHVITVAHCAINFINDPSKLRVRLGDWDLSSVNEYQSYENFAAEKIVIHHGFKSENLFNDIAIIKLDRQVEFKPHIDSVCLPDISENHEGEECVTTGWGKTSSGKYGVYSNILKEIFMRIVSKQDCQSALRTTKVGPHFKLHDGFICAGGGESLDACKGDGGGPLVCSRSDGSYSLVGIVSWGIDCGRKGIPGVYVDISKYLDWIVGITGKDLSNYGSSGGFSVGQSSKRHTKRRAPKKYRFRNID